MRGGASSGHRLLQIRKRASNGPELRAGLVRCPDEICLAHRHIARLNLDRQYRLRRWNHLNRLRGFAERQRLISAVTSRCSVSSSTSSRPRSIAERLLGNVTLGSAGGSFTGVEPAALKAESGGATSVDFGNAIWAKVPRRGDRTNSCYGWSFNSHNALWLSSQPVAVITCALIRPSIGPFPNRRANAAAAACVASSRSDASRAVISFLSGVPWQ